MFMVVCWHNLFRLYAATHRMPGRHWRLSVMTETKRSTTIGSALQPCRQSPPSRLPAWMLDCRLRRGRWTPSLTVRKNCRQAPAHCSFAHHQCPDSFAHCGKD